jgi:hypothetical protein
MSQTATLAEEPKGPYAVLRHLSLDVVSGAVGGAYMAATLFRSKLPWQWYAVLGISVWLVYTLDHLLDVRRLKDTVPTTARHRFHKRWFTPLAVIWLLLLATAVTLSVVYLPVGLLKAGGVVAAMALGHLALVAMVGSRNTPGITKEMGVALVYCTGIWLPTWLTGDVRELGDTWKYCVMLQHFLLAFSNVLLLSLYERQQDAAAAQTSMVQWAGEKGVIRLVQVLLGLAMVAGGFALFGKLSKRMLAAETLMLLMLLAHAQILFFPELFRKRERYRAWADFSFNFTWIMAFV